MSHKTFEEVQAVKQKYQLELLRKAHVIGVGIGYKQTRQQNTAELAVVVNVTRKLPLTELAPQDIIPAQLDGIPTDIVPIGVMAADEVVNHGP